MKVARTGRMVCLGALLAACGGGEPGTASDAAAAPADAPAPEAAHAQAAPPARESGSRTAAAVAPQPTAADSAAAAREDVSPEWKMNQRSMGSYGDCIKQANSVPEPARARLAAACRNLPGAPK